MLFLPFRPAAQEVITSLLTLLPQIWLAYAGGSDVPRLLSVRLT
jgi:hypothetical protein